MTSVSVLNAMKDILVYEGLGKTCTVWEKDDPVPLMNELPAVRLKVGPPSQETRLSGGAGSGLGTLGGYKSVEWVAEIHVFDVDTGDGWEAFLGLVDRIQDTLRRHYRLDGCADTPTPGTTLMYQAERMTTYDYPSEVTAEAPSTHRHMRIDDWVWELVDT